MPGGGPLFDPEEGRRSGKDGQAGRPGLGPLAPGGRTDAGLGSRERTGSHAGPVPSAGRSQDGGAPPQAASSGLFPASRGGSPGGQDVMGRSLHDLA